MPWIEPEAKSTPVKTLAGLADVDAGRLTDHATIDIWAKNRDKFSCCRTNRIPMR